LLVTEQFFGWKIDNEKYQIGGLSCIATLPNYRRQGLSSKIVQTATKWIEDNLDFGIFTCKRELEDFYACNGKWQVANNVVLIANRDNNALSSNKLAVIVLIRLFSNKAQVNGQKILNARIYLDLPQGQFI